MFGFAIRSYISLGACATNRPAAPEGIRATDRVGAGGAALAGSNPYHDENLLRVLSTLTDLSSKPHYRAAADAELKWFAENANHGATEQFRPWVLWDHCFELDSAASKRSLFPLTQQKIEAGTREKQRIAGFTLRSLAVGYAHTKDERFTRAMATFIEGWRAKFLDYTPSLAIDCEGAAHRVPEPLASRLRAQGALPEQLFCLLPNEIRKSAGFLSEQPRVSLANPNPRPRYTALWKASHDTHTTAQIGMMCVSRYDNTGNVKYRDLILAAADAYLDALPSDAEDVWSGTFGHAISLELAAWRHSADWKYMERARKLGDFAVEKFWGTNALPRASLKTEHYESITGADTLALALLELHLNILHITAVRCPPNTIDR